MRTLPDISRRALTLPQLGFPRRPTKGHENDLEVRRRLEHHCRLVVGTVMQGHLWKRLDALFPDIGSVSEGFFSDLHTPLLDRPDSGICHFPWHDLRFDRWDSPFDSRSTVAGVGVI